MDRTGSRKGLESDCEGTVCGAGVGGEAVRRLICASNKDTLAVKTELQAGKLPGGIQQRSCDQHSLIKLGGIL